MKRAKSQLSLILSAAFLTSCLTAALGKQVDFSNVENMALVLGQAGERYPIYGVGGIRVSGGHRGMWASNMKSSAIQIDGSGISAQKFEPFNVSTDFVAAANGAYFVSSDCICTLSTATVAAGQEIVVCNTNGNARITYRTVLGETLIGSDQSGPGSVDRFISDGKRWYRE